MNLTVNQPIHSDKDNKLNFNLIKGEFNTAEAIDLITQFFHVKIKFHENKIAQSENEEDIKMREQKIKSLQSSLFELRKVIESKDKVSLNSSIVIHE